MVTIMFVSAQFCVTLKNHEGLTHKTSFILKRQDVSMLRTMLQDSKNCTLVLMPLLTHYMALSSFFSSPKRLFSYKTMIILPILPQMAVTSQEKIWQTCLWWHNINGQGVTLLVTSLHEVIIFCFQIVAPYLPFPGSSFMSTMPDSNFKQWLDYFLKENYHRTQSILHHVWG